MEIEDIKNVWENENPEITPEISLEKQKEIRLPLEKIRNNMRMEFWTTLGLFLIIILFLIFAKFVNYKYQTYIISIIVSMILVTSFFFYKFFNFYKNLSKIDLSILENLKDLEFDFKLNKQYYLSYYIAFVPIIIPISMLIFEFDPFYNKLNSLQFIMAYSIYCSITIFILFVSGKWWFNFFYGKFFKKISILIETLK